MSEPTSVQYQDFRILQANVNEVKKAHENALKWGRNERIDVVLLQEPCQDLQLLAASPYYDRLFPYEGPKDTKAHRLGICIYKRRRIPNATFKILETNCNCTDDARSFHDNHIRTIFVEISDIRLYITNVYNRGGGASLDCLMSFRQYEDGEHFFGGDLNLHYRAWSLPDKKESGTRSKRFYEAMTENNFTHLLNEKGYWTWMRRDKVEGFKKSAIDL
jgi:exonuclease III